MYDGPAFAEAQVHGNGDVRHVNYGSDTGLFVEFRMESIHQEFESEKEGRPIYKQVPFIRIYRPGDKTTVNDRPVRTEGYGETPPDTVRFARQWDAFQRGAAQESSGFPLKEWPMMTTSTVRELNAVNIYTVEQLAAVSDANLGTLGHGGRNLRDKAVTHLEKLSDESVVTRMETQNADLQRQLDELKASITEKRGPGRPRKETEDAE